MRIIVITDTSFAASEAESIRILLSEGVDRVHLRKPQSAEADMRRLIEALPPELYPRLTLQDHLHLAGEYGIGGVHLNARKIEKSTIIETKKGFKLLKRERNNNDQR